MQPNVTIIVSPRERFSYAQQSLESIYTQTNYPFKLIYVDGGSPAYLREYLRNQARELDFEIIRTDYFLSPNQARNLGLAKADTEYVLFIDNDVAVTPGWLTQLMACAEETQATVVSPLTCIGQPLHERIHLAGGEAHVVLEVKGDAMRRRIHEKHYFVNRPVADVQDKLHRRNCEFAEFHCVLVRRSIFEAIGPLDEQLLSTREHTDFCLNVAQAGGKVYCEPAAVVTYVPEVLWRWGDLAYFMLRWSDDWELRSLQHFRQKWDLKKDKYFKKRYNRLGYRRHQAFIKPWVERLTFGYAPPVLVNTIIAAERHINHWVTARYNRLHLLPKAVEPVKSASRASAQIQKTPVRTV